MAACPRPRKLNLLVSSQLSARRPKEKTFRPHMNTNTEHPVRTVASLRHHGMLNSPAPTTLLIKLRTLLEMLAPSLLFL
jgi:hypothetical protein